MIHFTKCRQCRLQAEQALCCQEWRHCPAGGGCPSCSTGGRWPRLPPAPCALPGRHPASSPPALPQGATHQKSERWRNKVANFHRNSLDLPCTGAILIQISIKFQNSIQPKVGVVRFGLGERLHQIFLQFFKMLVLGVFRFSLVVLDLGHIADDVPGSCDLLQVLIK